MTADRRLRRRIRPELTATRVTAAFAVLLLALVLIPSAAGGGTFLALYLVVVACTALVLRRDRRVPGGWLSRRHVRQTVVGLIALDCAALLTIPATGAALGLALLLLLLNVALGISTQRIATAPDALVDERQEAERNRAHRIAYVLFAVFIGGTLLVADTAGDASRGWLQSTASGDGIVVLLELLFVLPAMVLAVTAPSADTSGDESPAPVHPSRLAIVLVGFSIAAPLLAVASLAVLPISTSSASQLVTGSGRPSAGCRDFQAQRLAGSGLYAQLSFSAEACWDGRRAVESYGMNASDCLLASSAGTIVTTTRCTQTTSADGTLTFVWSTDVESALVPFVHRQVTMELVVDRNGNVEQFP